ncbi:MAG: hypothetical protein JRE43_05580 [Deltaproteobacteria bacterium]|nr:hypothetical protein [Deltaproteobacteria bacterium]MBW2540964.1 hypothetical protein [Deltaproteobacteria bacterium]
MATPEALEYPALCCSRDNSVVAVESASQLCSCNARALFRSHYFDDLLLFDFRATPYRVVAVEPASPLGQWKRLAARLLNRRLTVVLELERLGEPSLSRAKQTAIQWIHRAPEFWEAAYEISEWEHRIAEASGMKSLCAAFR